MRPHPLPLGVDVADEIRVVALDLEIVHDHAAVGLPVAIGDDREHGPAGPDELLADLDRVGRRPADVDDVERMLVGGDDLGRLAKVAADPCSPTTSSCWRSWAVFR